MNTKGPEGSPFGEGNGIFCFIVLNKLKVRKHKKWAWWYAPVIPNTWRQRQEDPWACWPGSLAELVRSRLCERR